MGITKRGQQWRGTEAADIDAYLNAYTAESHPVGRIIHSACADCGGTTFAVSLDDEQGYADRRCTVCGRLDLLLDSEDVKDEADIGEAACPCGGESFEVAVGFAIVDDGDVRWVFLGLRCMKDGTLGVYADWKIDYSPTAALFKRV